MVIFKKSGIKTRLIYDKMKTHITIFKMLTDNAKDLWKKCKKYILM